MKKCFTLAITLLMFFTLFGCATKINMEEEKVDIHYDVIYLANEESIYSECNNDVNEGLKKYCLEKDLAYNYLQPEGNISEDRKAVISQALDDYSADIIVINSNLWLKEVLENAKIHNNVKFILIDVDNDVTMNNIAQFETSKLDCGFLTGYSLVKEGYTQLGFVTSENHDDYKFGFMEGIEYAASCFEEYTEINVNCGDETSDVLTWYDEGTEVIYAFNDNVERIADIANTLESKYVVGNVEYESDAILSRIYLDNSKVAYNVLKLVRDATSTYTNTINNLCLKDNIYTISNMTKFININSSTIKELTDNYAGIERLDNSYSIEETYYGYVLIN